jgi:hypothetical protein
LGIQFCYTNTVSAKTSCQEFDYINQFWAEVNISPGGPSPRWGASGGIDTRVAPINDPSGIPGPNNTIYLAGGTDDNGPITVSDIWELHLSGTLSSNLPNSSEGSWKHSPIGNLPAVANQAGTVVGRQIIAAGGCNTTSTSGNSCALQNSYVLNTGTNSNNRAWTLSGSSTWCGIGAEFQWVLVNFLFSGIFTSRHLQRFLVGRWRRVAEGRSCMYQCGVELPTCDSFCVSPCRLSWMSTLEHGAEFCHPVIRACPVTYPFQVLARARLSCHLFQPRWR